MSNPVSSTGIETLNIFISLTLSAAMAMEQGVMKSNG
jgi:hypothetical protein